MADLGLRPLSLGEILDRTFSLYRKHFLLFASIAAIPQFILLALRLTQTLLLVTPVLGRFPRVPRASVDAGTSAFLNLGILWFFGFTVWGLAYVYAQGGMVSAAADLYLGNSTTIGTALGKVRGHYLNLVVVVLLGMLALGAAFVCFIIPFFYVACRLIACLPAAVLEDLGPIDSLERSFSLTKGFAGSAFLIFLLSAVLQYAAALLFAAPFSVALILTAKHPETMPMWLSLTHVGEFIGGVVVGPFLTIAIAVFYYDLRVRKEAFDLQFMLNPNDPLAPQGPSIIPRSLY